MYVNNKKKDRKQPATYIRIPFVNDEQRSKILSLRKATKNQDNIRFIFRTQMPLGQSLRPNKEVMMCQPNCRSCSFAAYPNTCHKKYSVYKIVCQICQLAYIGQTGRTMRSRICEHITSSNSAVFQHFKCHSGLFNFKWFVLRTIKDLSTRLAAESIFINREQHLMNGCEGKNTLSFLSYLG